MYCNGFEIKFVSLFFCLFCLLEVVKNRLAAIQLIPLVREASGQRYTLPVSKNVDWNGDRKFVSH